MEVNYTALLVDMDLRNPGISNYFAVEPKLGLSDYLKGDAEVGDLLINPGVDRLLLLPGRGSLDNSSELISSPRMVSLFNELTQRYKSRIVIYDMPAVLPRDDVLTALNHVDCFLLVIEEGCNSEVDIRKAMQSMQNANIIGTVVNKSQTVESGYMPSQT
jgi:Mrp family chromosome partitioning ATPase